MKFEYLVLSLLAVAWIVTSCSSDERKLKTMVASSIGEIKNVNDSMILLFLNDLVETEIEIHRYGVDIKRGDKETVYNYFQGFDTSIIGQSWYREHEFDDIFTIDSTRWAQICYGVNGEGPEKPLPRILVLEKIRTRNHIGLLTCYRPFTHESFLEVYKIKDDKVIHRWYTRVRRSSIENAIDYLFKDSLEIYHQQS